MFWSFINFKNLKHIVLVVAIALAIWFFKDYQYQKSENQRQTENVTQLIKLDSLRFARQTYNNKEFKEHLAHNREDLAVFLKENSIKLNRINQIITQSLSYKDTTKRSINLQPIINAIQQEKSIKIPVIDSTKCLIIKGFVAFNNDTLSLNITDRKFKNKSDVVSYWQRRKWSFLGINTRFLGKKEVTVIIKDNCGNTQTFVIDKKKQ